MKQLDIFSPYAVRSHYHEKWWKLHQYEGPVVGSIIQCSSTDCGWLLPDIGYYCVHLNFAYVQAVNHQTEEALLHFPLLSHAPWCKDKWVIMDKYLCGPVTCYGFNHDKYRELNPEKLCPYPVIWGKVTEEYNRSYYAWKGGAQ